MLSLLILVGIIPVQYLLAFNWKQLDLPPNHIPCFFRNNPNIQLICENDVKCPYKNEIEMNLCWGYESSCDKANWYSRPYCPERSSWVNSKTEQEDKFWSTADFGMLSKRKKELKVLCKPSSKDDSSLECSQYMRYCKATNIFLDFTPGKITTTSSRDRYREDILNPGLVGGHCELDKASLLAQGEHKSPLQSWFAELQHFTAFDFYPSKGEECDIVLDKPTFLIKLDAGINMYHHFCDFVNLYASQHINNSFSTDINIIMWDTSILPYSDPFSQTWKAFTDHPIIPLKDLDGKRVCIQDAVFPLLARMRFGLYYNMPLMPGCYGSGLIKAFSEHILHRLEIPQLGPHKEKIRVTLLSRNTQYRNILNQEELVNAMKMDGQFDVNLVQYDRMMPFDKQLKQTHNSDIFIGMHGAGLTHLLFLPDWAVVLELYNCEDSMCYLDLARLRGIKYLAWENKRKLTQEDEGHHPTLGAHAKFTNYAFDVAEFMRIIYKAADHVRNHPKFVQARTGKMDQEKREDHTGKEEL